MERFVAKTARIVFENHDIKSLKDICVILPSRRATFFFKRALAVLSDIPFVSPSIFAIDDFVSELSGLQLADTLHLLFELYGIYCSKNPELPFNEFIQWGPTVLNDFDLIDQYLVPDPKALFKFMGEAEALSRWQPESDRPIRASENTTAYFRFYEELSEAYFAMRHNLDKKELAYRGMAYRSLAESFAGLSPQDFPFQHFYFVGLNALSKSEELIINNLVKYKKATCLWDTDKWFMQSDEQAGEILRQYRKSGGFGPWNEPENILQTTAKAIHVYRCPYETIQAKVASYLTNYDDTVFVVPDENLIPSLLYSLPEEVMDFNITMGLSLKQSIVWQLFQNVFHFQTQGIRANHGGIRFHYQALMKLLTDPLVSIYETSVYPIEKPFQAIGSKILRENRVFLDSDDFGENLSGDKLFRLLVHHWGEDPTSAVRNLLLLLNALQEAVFEALDTMEREFLMLTYGIVNRLEDQLRSHPQLKLPDLLALFNELSKQQKVPFTGEPIAPLQIMSLLETRCLDFKHVVFFSFNEGVLPSSQKNNSLIPYDACKAFGIPIYSDRDAIVAYHFYRLLMRAERVDLLFCDAGVVGISGGKEPSRFLKQLLHNLVTQNPSIAVYEHAVAFEKTDKKLVINEIIVEKKPELIEQMQMHLVQKGISVSALNDYFLCSLKFYFSRILALKDLEEVEEIFGNDVFGNWIHYSIESISKELIGVGKPASKTLKAKVLAAIPEVLDRIFQQHFSGYQADQGLNLIFRKMAEKLLRQYYANCFFDGTEKTIVASEYQAIAKLKFMDGESVLDVPLNGKIDSIELWDNELTLIDYKTGKVEANELNPTKNQTFSDTFVHPEKGKFRQLVMYKYLINREIQHRSSINGLATDYSSLTAGMYSFRNLSSFQPQATWPDDELMTNFETQIHQFITDLLNPSLPFVQTTDLSKCEYCSFKSICNR